MTGELRPLDSGVENRVTRRVVTLEPDRAGFTLQPGHLPALTRQVTHSVISQQELIYQRAHSSSPLLQYLALIISVFPSTATKTVPNQILLPCSRRHIPFQHWPPGLSFPLSLPHPRDWLGRP